MGTSAAFLIGALLVLATLPSGHAFNLTRMPGLYYREKGDLRDCPYALSLSSPGPTNPDGSVSVSASAVSVRARRRWADAQCTGGRLSVSAPGVPPNFATAGEARTRTGFVNGSLKCGRATLHAGWTLLFVEALKPFTSEVGSNSVRFESGRRYLILRGQCVLHKIAPGEAARRDRRNPWTWAAPLLVLLLLAVVAAAACFLRFRRRRALGDEEEPPLSEKEMAVVAAYATVARPLEDRREPTPPPTTSPASVAHAEMPPSPPMIVRSGATPEHYSPMPTPIRPTPPKVPAEFAARAPPPSLPKGELGPPKDNFALD